MRIAQSTIRAGLRPVEGRTTLTMEEIAARNARQTALNLICGEGCGDCCGLNPIYDNEFRCPLFEPELAARLTDAQRAEAAGCGIPALYAAVADGKTGPEAVTGDAVVALCPFLTVTGTGAVAGAEAAGQTEAATGS